VSKKDPGPFAYACAGLHAQPEVKRAIERWHRRIPDRVKARLPLLYWLLGDGTPPFKMSKAASQYGPSQVEGQRCANCRFAYQKVATGEVICSQVTGYIQLPLWCKLWRGVTASGSKQEA